MEVLFCFFEGEAPFEAALDAAEGGGANQFGCTIGGRTVSKWRLTFRQCPL